MHDGNGFVDLGESPPFVGLAEEAYAEQNPFLGLAAATDLLEEAASSPGQSLAPADSPFRSALTPAEEAPASGGWTPAASLNETPFLSRFEGEAGVVDRDLEMLAGVMAELQDWSFHEGLAELAAEAAAISAEHAAPVGSAQEASVERALERWLEPLAGQAEAAVDRVAAALGRHDLAQLDEARVDRIVEEVAPGPSQTGNPAFEAFIGGLVRKAGSVVRGAVNLARRGLGVVLGPVLEGLKRLVRPLLERVLRFAMDRLPAGLRPVAQRVARVLLRETEEEASEELAHEAAVSLEDMEAQMDERLAELLLLPAAEEQEAAVTEALTPAAQPETAAVPELDAARARLIERLSGLERGQDPRPALEEFIPAVIAALPAIRAGLKLGIDAIGRPRVVDFLAGHLATLVERYIGREAAVPLARAIVDTGLRLAVGEEGEDSRTLAAEALATTVEDTVRRVASLPGDAFTDATRLEAETLEAFNEAAARNVPASLLRPDLPQLEVSGPAGTWVLMPRPRRPRFYYKKYTRVFDVTLTPQIARSVTSFGGTSLEAFLRARGVTSLPVRARVHLYEALPGTWLSRIALHERRVPGLGSRARTAWSQLHPLTPAAAGLLLQEPGLGTAVGPHHLAVRDRVAVGQRFYYLELSGVRAATVRPGAAPRPSEVNITFDLRSAVAAVRVGVYLSETDAQAVAARLRQRDARGALTLGRRSWDAALRSVFSTRALNHIHVLSEAESEEQFAAVARGLAGPARHLLSVAGDAVISWIVERLLDTLASATSRYFQERAREFVDAADAPADGLTILVVIPAPSMVSVVRDVLQGRSPSAAALAAAGRGLAGIVPQVRTVPGFHR
ncbi:MAG TPA: hypothetical protein VNT51_01390 [Miltoncostaeaceae bacterium]|nr:hypothetical protein [Miltoncostaeaceae bacterium]